MPSQRLVLLIVAVASLIVAVTRRLEAGPPAQDARRDEVRELIDRYFRTWSAQDMERYGQCFMPQAAVQLIDEKGRLITMPLAPFLRSQQESHRRAANPMVETPEKVEIRFDAKLAHALVYWKLVDGNRIEYGYDHFTLMRHEGQWRIANLIFYSTPPTDGDKEQPAP